MKVYVAGQLADTAAVTAAQQQILAAGHTLTHDWTQEPCFTEKYASRPEESADIARTDLEGVMAADAVVVLASSTDPGRGLFVELGAALARAELGQLGHVIVVGDIVHESVFYFHPRVRRVVNLDEWLMVVGSPESIEASPSA